MFLNVTRRSGRPQRALLSRAAGFLPRPWRSGETRASTLRIPTFTLVYGCCWGIFEDGETAAGAAGFGSIVITQSNSAAAVVGPFAALAMSKAGPDVVALSSPALRSKSRRTVASADTGDLSPTA